MHYIYVPKGKKTQKGSSLFFAVLIMSILLAVGLGMSTLLIRQMRMIKGMGDSVVAFYAADTGIEKALYALYIDGADPQNISYTNEPLGDASYSVQGFSPQLGDLNCPLDSDHQYFCIKSVGTYKSTKRAIEVSN